MSIFYHLKKNNSLIYFLIIVALSSFLFFYKLGHLSLWDPDEPRYAEAAKQMVKTGDWLVPYFNGEERFDKPVLFYWLIALAYKIFGVSEFAARFWSAFLGLMGVIITYLLGKRMFSPRAGFLAGLILATNIQYITLSRLAITDMTLSFFLALAFFSFWFGYQARDSLKKNLFYLIFYISVALAALTKGPVAIVFAGFIILLFLILTKDLKALKKMHIFWGILIFITVAFPWYIGIIQKYGQEYVNYFFLKHNIARFITPELKHPGPFIYYLPILLIGLFPWSAFLFSSFWYLGRKKFNVLGEQKKQIIFLFIWFFTILLFFSVSRAKLPTYIMPLYFPAALVLGKFLELVIVGNKETEGMKKHIKISLSLMVFVFLATIIALAIALNINCPGSTFISLVINTWLLFGVIFILFLFWIKRFFTAFISLALVMSVFTILVLELVAPRAEEDRSLKEASLKVVSLLKPQDEVLSYRFLKPSIVFYCDQKVRRLENVDQFIEALDAPKRTFCWVDIDDEHYKDIRDLVNTRGWIIAKTPTKIVVSNQP